MQTLMNSVFYAYCVHCGPLGLELSTLPLSHCAPVQRDGSVVFDSLLIVTPIVGFCNCSMFCCALLCVYSSFAIISMGKRELIVLLCLSSWCLRIVVWLFLTIPRVCLQFVIVVYPYDTHLLFFARMV